MFNCIDLKIVIFFTAFSLAYCISSLGQGISIDLSGNYSSYALFMDDDEERYQDQIFAYGANIGMTLFLVKSDRSPFRLGADINYQYEQFRTKLELDNFTQKRVFDLFSSSAGICIGYGFGDGLSENYEFLLTGGLIFHSYVNQQIESNTFRISTEKPLAKYVEMQLDFPKKSKLVWFFSSRFVFDQSIESNFDRFFAINKQNFDLQKHNWIFKLGFKIDIVESAD